jgi:NitT/TauT family transport system permease protein
MPIGILRKLLFFTALIALWAGLAKRGVWDPTLFPSPWQVALTLKGMVLDRSLFTAVQVSLQRVLIGYSISLIFGVPLGMLLARARWAEETIGTLVVGLQALPSICWLPLALLWFGLNDGAILFVVVTGSLLAVAIAVQDGIKNVSPAYLRAARTMGTRPLALYTEVLMPASLPAILTGAKLGWSFAWRALMSGELLVVGVGLGQQLQAGRDVADMSRVIAIMLVIIALGLLVDRAVFIPLEEHARERWGLTS